MASVVVESRPPLTSTTAGRTLDPTARTPDQDVEARREGEAVAAARFDDLGHRRRLLLAPHAERHQKDLPRPQIVPRLDGQHFLDVLLAADDELEPCLEVAEASDRVVAQPASLRYAGV